VLTSCITQGKAALATWSMTSWRRMEEWRLSSTYHLDTILQLVVSFTDQSPYSRPVIPNLGCSQNLPGCSRKNVSIGVFFCVRRLTRRHVIRCLLPQYRFEEKLLQFTVLWPVKLMFKFFIFTLYFVRRQWDTVWQGECRGSALKLGHDRFLLNPFQFIVIHLPHYNRRYVN
jgi:hypothetical protein